VRLLIVMTCVVFAAVGAADVRSQDAVVLYQGAGDVIAVSDYSRLDIQGLAGKVTVRGGKDGELRFMCRDLGDRTLERKVTVFASGRKLILTAADPDAASDLLLEIAVPPGVSVFVDMADSKLHASTLYGPLRIKGVRLDVEARGLKDSVDLDVEGGTVNLQGIEGDLVVDASDVELKVWQLSGQLSLTLARSSADVGQVSGEADIDLDESSVTVNGVEGVVRANGREGKLLLGGLKRGAIVQLSGMTLTLTQTRGPIDVNTDSEVAFTKHEGNLRIEGYGAGLKGTALTGTLRVSSSDAALVVDDVGGDVTIRGDELDIDLKQLKADLSIDTASSLIIVDGVEGGIGIKSEYGEMVIHGAAKALEINSREDMITVSGQKGPFKIRANGPRATVHIAERTHEDDSSIENKGGDILLLLSPDVGVRIEVQADYGRIESSVRDLIVADGETRAAGDINETDKPLISIVSGGNVYIDPGILAGPND
jgi:hypothetical protein